MLLCQVVGTVCVSPLSSSRQSVSKKFVTVSLGMLNQCFTSIDSMKPRFNTSGQLSPPPESRGGFVGRLSPFYFLDRKRGTGCSAGHSRGENSLPRAGAANGCLIARWLFLLPSAVGWLLTWGQSSISAHQSFLHTAPYKVPCTEMPT